MRILEVKNLTKTYEIEGNQYKALDNLTFSVEKGDFVAIMGASGSGKSTLLNILSTLDLVSSGLVLLGNEDLSQLPEKQRADFRSQHLSFIFQNYNLLENLTLQENIALALTVKGHPKQEIHQLVIETAAKLGIEELLAKYPHQVSGGQRQRCACARALATSPDLILADEPTGALDTQSAKQLLTILKSMNETQGTTVLLVTHDAVAASHCQRVLFMQDGQFVNELHTIGQTQKEDFHQILELIGALGDGDDVS
ncbi:ABC transporter ATP-binding protein [Candidatus Enterococcus ferrettii]|uniref:ABC transporter domain-containing protein n=1 Tax=Candidatus Enterococcus ferrettii TaxID=2815324 RepID=A0ABV0ERU5_9ENTE|nr:ABC transporter ATP-binding protein [Enterococcus sp. 665A]MBO1341946.1 ABC transporter ATP-binding protein [Enterococcus sp. 665A]